MYLAGAVAMGSAGAATAAGGDGGDGSQGSIAGGGGDSALAGFDHATGGRSPRVSCRRHGRPGAGEGAPQ